MWNYYSSKILISSEIIIEVKFQFQVKFKMYPLILIRRRTVRRKKVLISIMLGQIRLDSVFFFIFYGELSYGKKS